MIIEPPTEAAAAVRGMFTQSALAVSALLPVVNPIGSALIIATLVGHAPDEVYKHMARRIALFMALFLAFAELLGEAFLRFFGITLPVVQLAGGLVLAGIGWQTLNKVDASPSKEKDVAVPEESYDMISSSAFYPYTFPITVGPGCLVVMLTLSAHAEKSSLMPDVLAHTGNMIAVVAMSVLVYFCYAYAQRITRKISPQTAQGILRIMGFIVLCIGTQIAWNGCSALLRTVLLAKP